MAYLVSFMLVKYGEQVILLFVLSQDGHFPTASALALSRSSICPVQENSKLEKFNSTDALFVGIAHSCRYINGLGGGS